MSRVVAGFRRRNGESGIVSILSQSAARPSVGQEQLTPSNFQFINKSSINMDKFSILICEQSDNLYTFKFYYPELNGFSLMTRDVGVDGC
jgi:hypothetical protein